jgi:RND family efflux transporter MFP subunit
MTVKVNFNALSRGVIAMCAIALLASCGNKGGNQQQMAGGPAQVPTYTVTTGSVNLNNTYPATIKGKSDVAIRPQISGFITKVCVDEGQRVSKGQTLFIIDQVELQAAVRSAQAAVVAANSQVSTARLTANNKKTLLDKNIISNYEYQTAALALQSARAQLNQAHAALVNARKNLSYSVVKAPCSGVVGSIPNREGSLASPSSATPLTTISDNNQIYAYFSLNEKQIIDLTDGGRRPLQSAINAMPRVQLRLSDGTIYAFPGKVSTVSGVLDQTTGSATVRALFPNENGMLRSGSTGEVVIPKNCQNVILVPQSATYEIQDMKYVYLVGPGHKAVSTPIEVLPENDGVNYVVTKGLKVGDVIAAEGIGTTVKDGVVIVPTNAPAKGAK